MAKRWHIMGRDIRTREPVCFETFEAASVQDATARLNQAGVAVESIEEAGDATRSIAGVASAVSARSDRRRPVVLVLVVALGVIAGETMVTVGKWVHAAARVAWAQSRTSSASPAPVGPVGVELHKGAKIADNVYVTEVAWAPAWGGRDGQVYACRVKIENASACDTISTIIGESLGPGWTTADRGEAVTCRVAPGTTAEFGVLVMERTADKGAGKRVVFLGQRSVEQ